MRGLLIAGGVALVVIAGTVTIVLEGRQLEKRELTMREAESASGEGFSLNLPAGWLIVDDDRVKPPVGGVALARRADGGRATIVIAPYADDTDQVYSRAGCQTVAKLHAKQIGTQLESARFESKPRPRCLATLDEGPRITGSMELQRIGPRSIMVTCRHPKDSASDAEACAKVAAGLEPR